MLDTLFLNVLDMTKAASLVILAVMGARLLLRRVPKAVSYALWLVVLFRLLCPVGFQSPVSLLPEIKPTAEEYNLEDQPISFSGAGMAAYRAVGDVLNGGIDTQRVATDLTDAQGNTVYVSTDMGDVWILFGSYVWGLGLCAMALYSGGSFLALKRKLGEALPLQKGVYLVGGIDSPFVMGRKIYLPEGLEDREQTYILAHERHHIRRGDPLWKALGFLALAVHWFNPLVWLAFVLACRDMEMSCDEAVVKTFGPEIRGDYCASLLKIATGKRIIAGAPLAFGEGDPKGRIRNLAKWKKPIVWISIGAAVLCLALAVCLLTDPVREKNVGRIHYFGVVKALEQDAQKTLILDCEDGRELVFQIAADYQVPPEIAVGATVMVQRAMHTEEWVAARVAITAGSMTETMEEAIESAILLMGGSEEDRNAFACASFVQTSRIVDGVGSHIGGTAFRTERVEVYGLALHQVYTYEEGVLEERSGSHIPVVITFRVTDGGQYVLEEYWMPRDGSYYIQDLREKFGVMNVPDTQDYIDSQQAECLAKARAHFGITAPPVLPPENVPPATESFPAFELTKVPENQATPLDYITPEYDRERALHEGAVLLENGWAVANTDAWDSFLQRVKLRLPARVRTVVLADGQIAFIREILYDGNLFQARVGLLQGGALADTWLRNYAYLQTFYGKNDAEAFVLTNQKLETTPQWGNMVFPSEEGYQLVYQHVPVTWVKPELPEQVVSAKLMLEEQSLAELTDGAKLQSLMELLSKAEYMEKANSYSVFEPLALVLEAADGTVMRCPIGTQQDTIRIDIYFFDYGPGRVERDGENHFRNAILEMVRHFGLEDWPRALTDYCMANGIEPPGHSLKVIVGEEPHG